MKFNFDPQHFFRIFFSGSGSGFQHEIYWQKVMFWILKVPIKFGSVSQSFRQNLNPVQDQDKDHNFTLDFNTRTTFYT